MFINLSFAMSFDVFVCDCDREKRIDQQERTSTGSSMQKVWIEIFNPTDSDKGKYTLEMFDGQETHSRSLDLSGQGEQKKRNVSEIKRHM